MALTYTPTVDQINQKAPSVIGDMKMWIGTVTFDSSYPTGGEVIAKADVGFSVGIDAVIILSDPAAARLFAFDPVNSKLKVFTALSTEAANASNQSTIVCPIIVIGR